MDLPRIYPETILAKSWQFWERIRDGEMAGVARDEVSIWKPDNGDSPFHFGEHVILTGWPQLWTLGDRAILGCPLLALFCSSQCPGDIILRTYDLARSLRDAGVPVIGGFHSPMEAECLDLLLRGSQPVVVCPARSIEWIRVPGAWKKPIEKGRLLLLSPFTSQHHRPTVPLAEKRNRLVAEIAHAVFVAHAAPQSKTYDFCRQLLAENRPVWTFDTSTAEPIRSLGARCFPSLQAIVDALSGHTQADGVLG
jgi:predicted Rossmann fold nucleotide-binding protein DprA/Smf involved in DNA uptake